MHICPFYPLRNDLRPLVVLCWPMLVNRALVRSQNGSCENPQFRSWLDMVCSSICICECVCVCWCVCKISVCVCVSIFICLSFSPPPSLFLCPSMSLPASHMHTYWVLKCLQITEMECCVVSEVNRFVSISESMVGQTNDAAVLHISCARRCYHSLSCKAFYIASDEQCHLVQRVNEYEPQDGNQFYLGINWLFPFSFAEDFIL